MQIMPVSQIKKFFTEGHERTVKAKKNIAASFVFKAGSILCNLALVPLTLHYLNPTRYGIWLTLYSIVGWFTFFDIGLGNGLRNKFAEALAKGEKEKARIYVSTTYGMLTVIVAILFIFFFVINPFIDWTKLLNAPSTLRNELGTLALIVFGFFCLKFVLQLIGTILIADQRPAYGNLISLGNNLTALVIVYILTITTNGSLVYLGTAISISPIIVFVTASFYFFRREYKEFIPSLKYFKFEYAKDLVGIGFNFFVIQLAAIILFTTDNVIISQLFGPSDVTPYNIAYKYFSVVVIIYMVILTPFWSAFTEAYSKQDFSWIKNVKRKSRNLWYVTSFVLVLMLLVSSFVYKIWVGSSIHIGFYLSVTMAAYILVYTYNAIYVIFINGVGKLRLQLISAIVTIIINIPLSILFAENLGLGIKGVMLATVVCMFINTLWLPVQYNKLITGSAAGVWAK